MAINASNIMLLGGAPCLDFVNTKNWHSGEKPCDFLTEYGSLLQWSLQLGLLTPSQTEQLFELAGQRTQEAQAALERARLLRETIYRMFYSTANAREIPAADLKLFNGAWTKALANLQVLPEQTMFRWKWVGNDEAFDSMLWPVLHSAAELLISEKLQRVKNCEGCGWLFLDTTKAGRRRWCDMRICGNRAKSRRHYAREKAGSTG